MGLLGNISSMLHFGHIENLKNQEFSKNSTELNKKDKSNAYEYVSNNALAPKIKTAPLDDRSFRTLAIGGFAKFIKTYLCEDVIDYALENNPNIKAILDEYNLPCKYNLENVSSIIMSHLIPCAKTAQRIYLNLGHSKNEDDYVYLTQAALLHDIGKVFIPEEILNKNGKLNAKEREIIELHNKLSFEILKTTNLSSKVVFLALEHHDYEKNVKRTQENQALTVADIYCALREKRPYKKALNDICAKTILYDMATSGKFDTKYISYIS